MNQSRCCRIFRPAFFIDHDIHHKTIRAPPLWVFGISYPSYMAYLTPIDQTYHEWSRDEVALACDLFSTSPKHYILT